MLGATARARRPYRRSHTVASLSYMPVAEVDVEAEDTGVVSDISKLLTRVDSPQVHSHRIHSPRRSLESTSEIAEIEVENKLHSSEKQKHNNESQSSRLSSKQPDMQSLSHHDVSVSLDQKKLSRTKSSPTFLLMKVKERIRDKVFLTTAEWPQAAAMVQERRQRANDILQASLCKRDSDIDHIHLKELHQNKKKRKGVKSGPVESDVIEEPCFNREAARAALRRRSISEDTYDRDPVAQLHERLDKHTSGVMCSNQDLKAIFNDHRRRRSPRPVRAYMRTMSVDDRQGMMGSRTMQCHFLSESTSSLHSSRSNRLGSSELEGSPIDKCEPDANGASRTPSTKDVYLYPEAILDSKTTDSSPVGEDLECSVKPKQPPEIVFDEDGLTWDVYGAEFDPEILGTAIQRHLEKLMKRKMFQAQQQRSQDDIEYSPSVNKSNGKSGDGKNFLRSLCLFSGRRGISEA